MRKFFHWLVVISAVLIPQILLFFSHGSTAAANSHAQKIIIKAGSESCAFRGYSLNFLQLPVLIGDCSLLSYEKPESMLWFRFPDDKVRASNGLCLSAREGVLQVGKCSTNQFEADESWAIDAKGEMRNNNNHCIRLLKGEDELMAFKCDDNSKTLEYVPLSFSFEPHNDVQHQLRAAQYADTKINMLNGSRFTEVKSYYSGVSWKLADLVTEVHQLKQMEKKIESIQQEAENYVEAAKLHMDELTDVKKFGSGVSVKVYDTLDTKNAMPSVSFTLNTIEINPQILESYGVENKGSLAIRIDAFISAPKDGHYTFVVRDLDSNLKITVDGWCVLTQLLRPLGDHASSMPVHLYKNKPVRLTIENFSMFGAPTFNLNWYSSSFDEKPLPNSYLFPDVIDESCAPRTRRFADCNTTFETFKDDGTFQVLCPAGCVALSTAFGSVECFSLDSSICFAATVAGKLPDKGGVITVNIKKKEKRSQYPAVKGFGEIMTDSHSVGTGCGRILSYKAELGSPFAVTDVKLVAAKLLISSSSNPKSFAGYEGVLNDADDVLLTKRGGGTKYITDIIMSCGQPQQDTDYEPVGGDIFVKRSLTANEPAVTDAYITFNEPGGPLLFPSYNGWSRKTCGDKSLYLKFLTQSAPMEYASHNLSCQDTFELPAIAKSPLSTFVVRCPLFCATKNYPVFGLFLYDSRSSICLAAIHSGAVPTTGGLVQVTRIESLPARKGNEEVTRNGVTAFFGQSTAPSYYLSPPRGNLCSYPSVPQLFTEKRFLRKTPVSFLEVSQQINPAPPAVELPKRVAILPNQVDRIMSEYNVAQPVSSVGAFVNPALLTYSPYSVAFPYSPQYQTVLAANSAMLASKQNGSTSLAPVSEINLNNVDTNSLTKHVPEDAAIAAKNSIVKESTRFQELLLKQQTQLAALQQQTIEIGSKFDLSSSAVSDLHAKIAKIRKQQIRSDGQRAKLLLTLETIQKAFREKLEEKHGQIQNLEKKLAEDSPIHSATYSETFKNSNINSRYVIIDGEKSSFAPSNWRIQRVEAKGYAITQDSGISSPKCFGSMAISRDKNLSKGFVFADILIPFGGGSVALIFKYLNNLNFKAFEISADGVAQFREMKNGVFYAPLGKVKMLPLANQWAKIGVDFGQKNVRGFVNGIPVTGIQISQDSSTSNGGSFGIATNGISGMTSFTTFIAGPLDNEAQLGPAAFGAVAPSTAIGNNSTNVVANVQPHQTEEAFGLKKSNMAYKYVQQSGLNCTLPFEENLRVPLSVNWAVIPNTGWSLGGDQEDKFINGTNKAHSSSFTASAIFLKRSAICHLSNNVKISVYIRLQSSSRAGIAWRASSSTSFNAAVIDVATSKAPKVSVFKVDNKTPYEFSAAQPQITSGTFYKLEVFNNAFNVRVILDGQTVMEEALPINEKNGQIGLIILDGNAHFKDFKLSVA